MNFSAPEPATAFIPRDVGSDPDDPASAFRLLQEGMSTHVPGALLTITGIDGGAPRALGTHMSVLADSRYCGYVSGGCVEAAVAVEAVAVLRRGRDEVLRFGRNSPFFDIRLPCGGGIDVHVHVAPQPELVNGALDGLGARRAFDIGFDPLAGTARLLACDAAPESGFRRRYRPATRLVLIGQGNELPVAAAIARAAGIETTAYAAGPGALAAAERVGAAVTTLDGHALSRLAIDRWTAVVFLFHDHEAETELLSTALRSDAFYVGALGSRRTHAARVGRLVAAGLPQAAVDKIRAPIGLIEQTREASSLAFSILADITRERMRLDAMEVP
jgi:xanthine dehydrogenase accessory factor